MTIPITPFTGLNQIAFGQSLEQVKLLLGEPTESTKEKHDDGTEDISFLYQSEGLELSFMPEDDFRLGLITCYTTNYALENKSIIGLSEAIFLAEMDDLDVVLAEDLMDLNAKDYTIESKGLSIWIQDGHVHSITLFPQYDEHENIVWPK